MSNPSDEPERKPDPPPAPTPDGVAPLPGEKTTPAETAEPVGAAPRAANVAGPGPPIGPIALLAILILLTVLSAKNVAVEGKPLHLAFGLKKALLETPAEAWRLVTALFVHAVDPLAATLLITTVFTLGGPRSGGARTSERHLGTGAMFFIFVVGGALANLARVAFEPANVCERVSGALPGALALMAAGFATSIRTRDPHGITFGWLGTRAAFAIFALVIAVGVVDPNAMGNKIPDVLPGVGAALAIGFALGFVLPVRPSPVRLALAAITGFVLVLALGGIAHRLSKHLGNPGSIFKVDPEAALEEVTIERLAVRLKIPRALIEVPTNHKELAAYQSVLGLPQVRIVRERGGRRDTDVSAEDFARSQVKELNATLEDGPRVLSGTPYRAHYTILSVPAKDPAPAFILRSYFIAGRSGLIVVLVSHDPSDDSGPDLADSIAKSVSDLSDK